MFINHITYYDGQSEHKMLLPNIVSASSDILLCFTVPTMLIYVLASALQIVIQKYTEVQENPLQSELANLAKYVGFYKVDEDDGELFNHQHSHEMCQSIRLAIQGK